MADPAAPQEMTAEEKSWAHAHAEDLAKIRPLGGPVPADVMVARYALASEAARAAAEERVKDVQRICMEQMDRTTAAEAQAARLREALNLHAPACHICGTRSRVHSAFCSAVGDPADRALAALTKEPSHGK